MEQFTSELHKHSASKEDRIMQTLSNIVSNSVSIKLEKTIKYEMNQTVLNTLEKAQTKFFENISNQIAQVGIWVTICCNSKFFYVITEINYLHL